MRLYGVCLFILFLQFSFYPLIFIDSLFPLDSPLITSHSSIRSEYSMTGNDDCNRIGTYCSSHCTNRTRMSYFLRNFRVTWWFSSWNKEKLFPDLYLKISSIYMECKRMCSFFSVHYLIYFFMNIHFFFNKFATRKSRFEFIKWIIFIFNKRNTTNSDFCWSNEKFSEYSFRIWIRNTTFFSFLSMNDL